MNEIIKFSFDKYYNENGEKYIGEMKNGLKDGKGIYIIIKMMSIKEKDMKVILKMVKEKEKE